jgi:hypothetical protein
LICPINKLYEGHRGLPFIDLGVKSSSMQGDPRSGLNGCNIRYQLEFIKDESHPLTQYGLIGNLGFKVMVSWSILFIAISILRWMICDEVSNMNLGFSFSFSFFLGGV